MLCSDGKDLVVLVFVSFFPFQDAGLRSRSVGPSHLDPIVDVSCIVAVLLSKAVDVARAVGLRWHSHEGINQMPLVFFSVHPPMLVEER